MSYVPVVMTRTAGYITNLQANHPRCNQDGQHFSSHIKCSWKEDLKSFHTYFVLVIYQAFEIYSNSISQFFTLTSPNSFLMKEMDGGISIHWCNFYLYGEWQLKVWINWLCCHFMHSNNYLWHWNISKTFLLLGKCQSKSVVHGNPHLYIMLLLFN